MRTVESNKLQTEGSLTLTLTVSLPSLLACLRHGHVTLCSILHVSAATHKFLCSLFFLSKTVVVMRAGVY